MRGLGSKRQPLAERFWEKVQKTDGCWLWTRNTGTSGYGQFSVDGHKRIAHRVSWEMENGTIPDGMCVLHHCDVPSCVRPSHLFIGDNTANMIDMVKKGRQARKLTDKDVLEIRSSNEPQRIIAARYGIAHSMVSAIKSRKAWAHLDLSVAP